MSFDDLEKVYRLQRFEAVFAVERLTVLQQQTHLTTAPMNVGGDASVDVGQLTPAQRAALPLSADVVDVLAEQHGVCTRPLAMRRIDTSTGRIDIVPVACGSTAKTNAGPVRARLAGFGWRNAARVGT